MTDETSAPDPAPDPAPQPLTLWLTDRSRFESGVIHCPRARYLSYHAGPHGYGWMTKAESMPTVTGTLVHDPITAIFRQMMVTDQIPDDRWVYDHAIAPAMASYQQIIDTRGLANILEPDQLALRAIEQTTLLEGLVWMWVWEVLPEYHAQYQVVLVEEELPVVLGCSCGLGDRIGTLEDHDHRDCTGIGYMTKADAIGRHRITGTHRYDEFKTTSDASMNWEAAWQYRAQVISGVLGAEQRLGATIDEVWIHGLIKGSHRASWDPELKKAAGEKYQQSVLCYGWRRPANPPLYDEAWAHSQKLPPDPITGKGKRLTKDYVRTGIWELPSTLWSSQGALSPSHYWCGWIRGEGLLAQQYKAVGPIYREAWRLESFIDQLLGEEQRTQVGVWAIYDAIAAAGGDYAHPDVQRVLDRHFPQAGGDACHSFFGAQCPNLRICKRQDGWDDPGRVGYLPRRPHHAPELDQAIARGLLLPEVGATSSEDEEDR